MIDDQVDKHRATGGRKQRRTSLTTHHHHVTGVALTTHVHTEQHIDASHCHAKTRLRRCFSPFPSFN